MENLATIEKLQDDILRIIGVIQMSKEARRHFLDIMGVMFGQEHPDYKLFEELTSDQHIQQQMLRTEDTYKYKQQFKVFCHIVLKDFIKQVNQDDKTEIEGPKENIPEKDILLEHYFQAMGKASQYSFSAINFDESKFTELKKLEYSLLRRIIPHHDGGDPVIENEFTLGNYRQLLTVWLMYTQLIFYPQEVEKIINLCKTGKIII